MINKQIYTAITLLHQGKPIAFPTDTVYGLGANPQSEQAILSIFTLKQRSLDNPLAILIPNIEHINYWVDPKYLSPELLILAKNFWPGPLTIVTKKSNSVSNLLTSGQDTIAIRIPNHPLALELLNKFNYGLIGSSANRSGNKSPTTYQEVINEFDNQIFAIDGGPCPVGIESTIISLVDSKHPKILRQGAINTQTLLDCLDLLKI